MCIKYNSYMLYASEIPDAHESVNFHTALHYDKRSTINCDDLHDQDDLLLGYILFYSIKKKIHT